MGFILVTHYKKVNSVWVILYKIRVCDIKSPVLFQEFILSYNFSIQTIEYTELHNEMTHFLCCFMFYIYEKYKRELGLS